MIGLSLTAAAALAAGAGLGAASLHSTPEGHATTTSRTMLSTSQIAGKVDPGLVDVTSTLGDQGAVSKGTGIVLSADGIVLTNNHVVDGATSVSVRDIGNNRTYQATVAGYDRSHDVAVLRLAGASGLTTAATGDSATVQAGEKVVALGNAGGLDGTPSVAPGTVTALNQSITASDESSASSEQLSGLIESNAGIEPGDSGGPLVNSYGQVVGINTAASSGYQLSAPGSGTQAFTIPIGTALSIADQITGGQASSTVHIGDTAFLGIEISSQSPGYGQGVTIAGVVQGTPAAGAGLTQGDTITAIAGQDVSSGTAIQDILVRYHPGDRVTVTWINAYGETQNASVTLASGPVA